MEQKEINSYEDAVKHVEDSFDRRVYWLGDFKTPKGAEFEREILKKLCKNNILEQRVEIQCPKGHSSWKGPCEIDLDQSREDLQNAEEEFTLKRLGGELECWSCENGGSNWDDDNEDDDFWDDDNEDVEVDDFTFMYSWFLAKEYEDKIVSFRALQDRIYYFIDTGSFESVVIKDMLKENADLKEEQIKSMLSEMLLTERLIKDEEDNRIYVTEWSARTAEKIKARRAE